MRWSGGLYGQNKNGDEGCWAIGQFTDVPRMYSTQTYSYRSSIGAIIISTRISFCIPFRLYAHMYVIYDDASSSVYMQVEGVGYMCNICAYLYSSIGRRKQRFIYNKIMYWMSQTNVAPCAQNMVWRRTLSEL